MTNEELLTDLKQFIEATMSQRMSHFATKDDLANLATKDDIHGLKKDIALLDQKLDLIEDAIADTVQDHEQRLRRLEHRSA